MTRLQSLKQAADKMHDLFFNELSALYQSHGMVLIKLWETLDLSDLINETWLPVVGLEEKYLVSNYGRFKSLPKRNRKKVMILRQYFDNIGYLYVSLSSKKYKSHRIVSIPFIQNPESKKTVNHKNGIKWVNAVFNLEWNTSGENQKHALRTGLKNPKRGGDVHNAVPVIQYEISGQFIKEWGSMADAGRDLNIDDTTISKCCKRNINYTQAYGFVWRFKKEVAHLGQAANLPTSDINVKAKPKFFARRRTTQNIKLWHEQLATPR